MRVVLLIVVIIMLIYFFAPKTAKAERMLPSTANLQPRPGLNYVIFYDMQNRVLFEADNLPNSPAKWFKNTWRGEIDAIDINLNKSDSAELNQLKRVDVWEYFPDTPIQTTLGDFYNIYTIPEHMYDSDDNLRLVARVFPGSRHFQRLSSPSKRFLIRIVI